MSKEYRVEQSVTDVSSRRREVVKRKTGRISAKGMKLMILKVHGVKSGRKRGKRRL